MDKKALATNIGYKSIWLIAYPIIIGSIAQNIIQVTDTAFLGHLSNVALGGAAIGSLFYFSCVMLLWGLSIGTQIIIARRFGENAQKEIGNTFSYAFLLQLFIAMLLFVIMRIFGKEIFHYLVQSDDVLQESRKYIKIRAWGIIFSGINLIFRAFYIGIANTRIIGISTILMAIINVFFDYVLIFGKWGFPFMGIEGAALASVIAECFTTIVFILFTFFKVPFDEFGFFRKLQVQNQLYLTNILKISLPMMMQLYISLVSWFIFFLLIEKMGELELAISNIIRSLYIFLMMPVWGFASAANTLTSQLIGKRMDEHIFSMLRRCINLNLLLVTIVVSLGVIFAKSLLSLYTNDENVILASLPVFYVICVAAFFFAASMTFFHALSGTGKTQIALYIEIITISIYLFLSYIMINKFKQPLYIVWSADIIYAIILGTCSILYMKFGKWKKKYTV